LHRFSGSSGCAFLADLIGFGGRRLIVAEALAVAAAASEGIGLLLLIPLLAATGVVPAGSGSSGPLVTSLAPLGLAGVLSAFIAVVAGRALLVGVRDVRAAQLHLCFGDDLRNRLFRAISHARWSHLTGLRRSDLLQALTADVARVGSATQVIFDVAASGLIALAHLGIAVYLSVPATVLTVAVGAVLEAASAPQLRRARLHGQRLTARNRQLYATATDFLDGLVDGSVTAQPRRRRCRTAQQPDDEPGRDRT
jgi:ATP-binding cassette, subfamily C, bacterial